VKPTIQCTECQAVAVVVKHSWPRPDGRVQLLICKSCGHESKRLVEKLPPKEGTTVRRDPGRERRFSAETITEIRARGAESRDSWAQLAREYRCSREAIRQICLGLAYRDLLPDDFVAPNNGRKCWHCIEWRGLDDEIHPCTIGMPDVLTEGESFAADCEFYVRKGS
jgi:hypothetical protein